MQVSELTSHIVAASNGGCDTFDINRSLASGVVDLNPVFSDIPLSMLVLGIIVTQSPRHRSLPSQSNWEDWLEEVEPDTKEKV